jgi:hypothetical protein
MAKMTARLISDVLKPLWDEESAPVVSETKGLSQRQSLPFACLRKNTLL